MLSAITNRFKKGQLLPYRLTYNGGLLNTMVLRPLRQSGLVETASRELKLPGDVTIIMAHRNRADWRLVNAVLSIKNQSYRGGKVRILVVDYGSNDEQLSNLKALSESLGFECILVQNARGAWNKCHCVNIGLKHTTSPYVMLYDVDNLLSPDYLKIAVDNIVKNPLTISASAYRLLPETLNTQLISQANARTVVDTTPLIPFGTITTDEGYSTGMMLLLTAFLKEVNGLDEWYKGYGAEDVDLYNRLIWLGLKPVVLEGAYLFHQWHPMYEGNQGPDLKANIERNNHYLNTNKTIRRNLDGWGEAEVQLLVPEKAQAGR